MMADIARANIDGVLNSPSFVRSTAIPNQASLGTAAVRINFEEATLLTHRVMVSNARSYAGRDSWNRDRST